MKLTQLILRNGIIPKGTPWGINNEKKCKPCLKKPIILIPINKPKAKETTKNNWLVIVKLKGIIPSILQVKIKVNKVNNKGKKSLPFFAIFSTDILYKKSYKPSKIAWYLFGITVRLVEFALYWKYKKENITKSKIK